MNPPLSGGGGNVKRLVPWTCHHHHSKRL